MNSNETRSDELREDEIEALLKFDGAKLTVTRSSDTLFEPTFTAIIEYSVKAHMPEMMHCYGLLTRESPIRIAAIRAVWDLYQKRQGVPVTQYGAGEIDWVKEDVEGRVAQLRDKIILDMEKQNG